MDKITLSRIETAHPAVRAQLREIYSEVCQRLTGRAQCRFTEVLRSNARQAELYAQGRSKPGKIVTNAKPGQSWHQYGLGIDFCLIIDGKEASWNTVTDYDHDSIADWMEVVNIFKEHGWEWSGDWKTFREAPHVQCTFGLPIAVAQSRKESGLVDEHGYIRI